VSAEKENNTNWGQSEKEKITCLYL